MSRADLTGASLRHALVDMLDLTDADLLGADLSDARLKPCPDRRSGACLSGARFDARTILPFSRAEAVARGMVAIDR
jgi:uncharacterized protein YjbI with pentapeptide repeats